MLRDIILNAKDSLVKPIEVKEWGCTVYIRSFNCVERSNIAAVINETDKAGKRVEAIPIICSQALCDADGCRLFSDADVAALSTKNGKVMDNLALAALIHNGIVKDSVEEAKKN